MTSLRQDFDRARLVETAFAYQYRNNNPRLCTDMKTQYKDIDIIIRGRNGEDTTISVKESRNKGGYVFLELAIYAIDDEGNCKPSEYTDGWFRYGEAETYAFAMTGLEKPTWCIVNKQKLMRWVKTNPHRVQQFRNSVETALQEKRKKPHTRFHRGLCHKVKVSDLSEFATFVPYVTAPVSYSPPTV